MTRSGTNIYALRKTDRTLQDFLRDPNTRTLALRTGRTLHYALPIPINVLETLPPQELEDLSDDLRALTQQEFDSSDWLGPTIDNMQKQIRVVTGLLNRYRGFAPPLDPMDRPIVMMPYDMDHTDKVQNAFLRGLTAFEGLGLYSGDVYITPHQSGNGYQLLVRCDPSKTTGGDDKALAAAKENRARDEPARPSIKSEHQKHKKQMHKPKTFSEEHIQVEHIRGPLFDDPDCPLSEARKEYISSLSTPQFDTFLRGLDHGNAISKSWKSLKSSGSKTRREPSFSGPVEFCGTWYHSLADFSAVMDVLTSMEYYLVCTGMMEVVPDETSRKYFLMQFDTVPKPEGPGTIEKVVIWQREIVKGRTVPPHRGVFKMKKSAGQTAAHSEENVLDDFDFLSFEDNAHRNVAGPLNSAPKSQHHNQRTNPKRGESLNDTSAGVEHVCAACTSRGWDSGIEEANTSASWNKGKGKAPS